MKNCSKLAISEEKVLASKLVAKACTGWGIEAAFFSGNTKGLVDGGHMMI